MKLRMTCSLCKGRGKLWLGGRDYVECPDCLGARTIDYDQTKARKAERVIFNAGLPAQRVMTDRIIRTTLF